MSCFERAGLEVPQTEGQCVCGITVRFDIASHRIEHFLICPVVDEMVKAELPADIDMDAVTLGIVLGGGDS